MIPSIHERSPATMFDSSSSITQRYKSDSLLQAKLLDLQLLLHLKRSRSRLSDIKIGASYF